MNQEQAGGAVTYLATFRLARRAADVLRGLLHEPVFLISVTVEVQPAGDPVVVALVRERTRRVLMCFPSSIDDVRVVVRQARQTDTNGKEGRP